MTRNKVPATDRLKDISVHVKHGQNSNIGIKRRTRERVLALRRLRADGRKESIIVRVLDAYERCG